MNGLSGMLSELIQKAAVEPEPGDFWKGEILHCGKCRAPRMCWIDLDGKRILVGCQCTCREEDLEAEKAALKKHERVARIASLRIQGIQDRALMECTFSKASRIKNTENMRKCGKYVSHWEEMRRENCGILMTGLPGRGKTFAAACIANALIDKGVPVLVTSFPKILNSGGWDKGNLIDEIKYFDLLVLDDLGTERKEREGRANGYALEIMQMVIDERYKARKPLIVTTNLSRQQMENPGNMDYQRIFDRLREMCAPMHFDGDSFREEEGAKKMRIMREVFG